MLKHENAQEAPTQTAAQARVTPEELAAAVTALEARRQGTPDTPLISDAVTELSLTNTPEDILREVQARRERKIKQVRRTAIKRKWAATLSLALLGLTGLGIYSVVSSGSTDDTHPEWGQIIPATTPFALEPHVLALDPASPKHTIATLAEAPDGKTVYCSLDAINTIARCRNRQWGTERQISQWPSELIWPVVKHGRDVFVRGWIRQPLSKEAAEIADVPVFNTPHLPELGPTPQQVTFKLDSHISGVGLGGQRVNADGSPTFTAKGDLAFVFHEPRLTPHAYEKWQP